LKSSGVKLQEAESETIIEKLDLVYYSLAAAELITGACRW